MFSVATVVYKVAYNSERNYYKFNLIFSIRDSNKNCLIYRCLKIFKNIANCVLIFLYIYG